MRFPMLIAALTLTGAAPAFAQQLPLPPYTGISPAESGLLVQQEQIRQQIIQQQAQLQALDAQIRTEQNIQEVQRLRIEPRLPPPPPAGRPQPSIDTSQLASIPDAALADSNKKVLDAAGNHH